MPIDLVKNNIAKPNAIKAELIRRSRFIHLTVIFEPLLS